MIFTKITNPAMYSSRSCARHVSITYNELVKKLGIPFFNSGGEDFPDDENKVDVCWGFVSDTGARLSVWNYKNGPVYLGSEYTLAGINRFSFDYRDEEGFKAFCQQYDLKV